MNLQKNVHFEKFLVTTNLVDLSHCVVRSLVLPFQKVGVAHSHDVNQNCVEFHCVHHEQLDDGNSHVRLNLEKKTHCEFEKHPGIHKSTQVHSKTTKKTYNNLKQKKNPETPGNTQKDSKHPGILKKNNQKHQKTPQNIKRIKTSYAPMRSSLLRRAMSLSIL